MLNFDWLSGVSVGTAKTIFLLLFVIIGVLVMFVPRDYVYEGIDDPKWYHNLKLWAIGDLVFIFIVYAIF